jgi:hypothetical protein
MITATINMDPSPTLLKYLPMKGVTITGPVEGIWTIASSNGITQPQLDSARDAVLAFAAEIANKVILIGVAKDSLAVNIDFLANFDVENPDLGVAVTQLIAVTKQSTAALRVLTSSLENTTGAV